MKNIMTRDEDFNLNYKINEDWIMKPKNQVITNEKKIIMTRETRIFNNDHLLTRTRLKSKLGESKFNTNGSYMKIIKYNGVRDIDVLLITILFSGEIKYHIKKSFYSQFEYGKIKSPYDRSVYGVGYIGEGKYSDVKRYRKIYKTWKHMLERCYGEIVQIKHPTYKDVSVYPRFHNFQIFCQWVIDNYYEFDGHSMQLDKDILFKGNKIYSPENCCIVPSHINTLFTKGNKRRGNFPIGVNYDSACIYNPYGARLCVQGKDVYLGAFPTPEEAFLVYKLAKESEIKRVADYYLYEKGGQFISQYRDIVYPALLRYKVEITD